MEVLKREFALEKLVGESFSEWYISREAQEDRVDRELIHGINGLIPFHKLVASATGTSTGALALGGLTLRDPENPEQARYSTQDMIDFYKNRGPEIFSCWSFENCRNNWCCKAPSWRKAVVKWLLCCGCCGCCRNGNGLFGPKYGNEPLETILQEQFGEAQFKDSLIPIQFTTYDAVSRGPLYLGTRSTPNLEVWKGGRGSGSAPTFFRSFPVDISLADGTIRHARLMDGGIVENFPRAQAHHIAPLAAADDSQFSFDDGISLLIAIGTGRAVGVDWERLEHGGVLSLVEPIIDIATSAPDDANAQRIKEMMGNRYFDLQSDIPADREEMDDPENMDPLIAHAQQYAQTSEEIERLLKYLPGGELYEREFKAHLMTYIDKAAEVRRQGARALIQIQYREEGDTSSGDESLKSQDAEDEAGAPAE